MSPDPIDPTPPAPTVPWYQSQRFTALWHSVVLFALFWVGTCLTTGVWEWKSAIALLLSNIVLVLRDWWSDAIIAPIAALNKPGK